jgi:acylphosphatase
MIARRYKVRGRVQGVGFRDFVQRAATSLGLKGFARNDDDGSVEVMVVGPEDSVSALVGLLHSGPRMADVRGVEEHEAPVQQYGSFDIKP